MNFNTYKCNLEYPLKDRFATIHAYKNGAVVFSGTYDEFMRIEKPVRSTLLTEKIVDEAAEAAYKLARKAYYDEENRLKELFKKNLADELGLTGHPKFDLLFRKAWDDGSSHGYEEVANIAEDLAELIR